MAILLVLIGLVGFVVGIFMWIKKLITKRTNRGGLIALTSFILIIVGFIVLPTPEVAENNPEEIDSEETTSKITETEQKPEETPEEKAAREAKEAEEKALAEQKAKEEAAAKAKAEEEAKAQKEAERLAKLEALKLSGNGDSVSNTFTLEEGFVVVNANYDGERNFAVKLYDESGNQVDLLFNTIGSYTGSQALMIPTGNYKYEVTASGPWTIQMSQEIPENVLPQGTATGSGDSVYFMEITQGSYTVTGTHDGERNFAVKANDSALLFNTIGPYNGQMLQQVNDTSVYFFNVTADGNWSITFE